MLFHRLHTPRALAPLARTSIDNAVHYGAAEALTGPVARGEEAELVHAALIGRK